MRGQLDNVHRVVAALAAETHGVVSRRRLLAAKVPAKQIDRLVASGALIGVHRGVYRVGHAAPSREATYMAAVLACGRGALLGGAASCHLLSLIDGVPPPPEVWAPGLHVVPGVRARRSKRMDRWLWLGIPTVSPVQALIDVADVFPVDALARACHQAG